MFYPCGMSLTLNGSVGSQNTRPVSPPPKPRAPANKETHVAFQTAAGVELRGPLGRMMRHSATFEIYSPKTILSTSEALTEFSINFQGKVIYFGRAVIRSLVETGGKMVCDVALDEQRWLAVDLQASDNARENAANEFGKFLQEWQKIYIVSPEFKIAVSDMQTFFRELRIWLNQLELQTQPAYQVHDGRESEITLQLAALAVPAINALFEKFEAVAKELGSDQRAAYASYMRQNLHPLVLCAPFASRTFQKPRGYAGDYEMVNMIIRNGFEGDSLFAKILHFWFVSQPPAEAHRNRIAYLVAAIQRENLRLSRLSRPMRVFNFACGPAAEVQKFLQTCPFPADLHFTLADFDQETLEFARRFLRANKALPQSELKLNFRKMSVLQLIKEARKSVQAEADGFDLVYCAGLFDYLPDNTCKDLMDIFYDLLAPGGLLIATNVEESNPLRYGMEYLLDWHLIYRNDKNLLDIRPQNAELDEVCVRADDTGVNLFLEVRKPLHE